MAGLVKDATLLALHGSNVHCEFTLAADGWPVEVDEGQFRQVIQDAPGSRYAPVAKVFQTCIQSKAACTRIANGG